MTWAWMWRCRKAEEGAGGHPGRWKPGVVGQEEAGGAAGVVQSHCPAAAAELGEHWNSRLLGEVGEAEGQQTRGEGGKKGARVAGGFPGRGSPWEVVEGGCFPSVVVVEEEPEGEQSPAWLLRGIRSEELVAGGSG